MPRGKTQLPPDLEIDGADYEVPETEYTHARIVGNATQGEVDACILVPTLRPDYLEYHALTALFTSPRNTSVMVMSSNAGVRRRYKDLGLRGPHLIYSETHWTLASVKAGGDLAQKTELYTNQDGYPQFLYAKYSTRLPKAKTPTGCTPSSTTARSPLTGIAGRNSTNGGRNTTSRASCTSAGTRPAR
ncbi:hypothetical protein [Haloplanus litoreus]|uniref:Uncharacterized protein n=1 Tax=Haloplanus litoreus TaxID=767515 RepID=A0ABD6A4K0_9EURY